MNTPKNAKSASVQERIIKEALEMFKTKGIKAVRMDDVSKELKISKRTLYEHFEDKEQLLLECIRLNYEKQTVAFVEYAEKAEGVMDVLSFYVRQSLDELSHYNHNFYVESIKYASVRDFIEEKRQEEKASKELFVKRGIEEGLILGNINFELLNVLNRNATEIMLREKLYERFTMKDIFSTFLVVFLRGILTDKGIKEFSKYLEDVLPT